jgi:hypothetical protein
MAQETVEQLILERDALVRAGQNANEAVGEVRGLEADLETERARANIAATNLEFLRDEFKKLIEGGGFVRCHFTPDRANEAKIKEEFRCDCKTGT